MSSLPRPKEVNHGGGNVALVFPAQPVFRLKVRVAAISEWRASNDWQPCKRQVLRLSV